MRQPPPGIAIEADSASGRLVTLDDRSGDQKNGEAVAVESQLESALIMYE